MKKLLKSFSPLVAFILILNNPIIAQLNSTELITTTTDRDRDDDNGKWGLIGLVGLPGLMGLKKNDKTNNYTTSNSPQNR